MIGGSWLIRQFDKFAAAIASTGRCIGSRDELTTRSSFRRSRSFLARRCINRRSRVLIFFWHGPYSSFLLYSLSLLIVPTDIFYPFALLLMRAYITRQAMFYGALYGNCQA